VRVLPKLKYKKEKPVEKPTDYTLPLAAGAIGLLALGGAGLIYLRKRKAGAGPLKIWQGFRKKKAAEPQPEEARPLHEVTPESLMQ
jgi:pilus assembly protein FimV